MYTLYSHPFSQHARRVISLLEEARLQYELKQVSFEDGEHVSPAYLKLNPNHQVPVLVDGDIVLYESNAILRYLCVKHQLTDWLPPDLAARAKTEQWLDWAQSQMSPAVIGIVFNKVFMKEKGDKAAIKRGEEKLAELSPILSAALENSDFLAGPAPTIADLAVGSNVTQLGLADAAPTSGPIADWYARVAEIPGFRHALPPAL